MISPSEKCACPTTLLKRPAKNAFKHLILKTPLCQHLLLSMSSNPMSVELSDTDCKKGQFCTPCPSLVQPWFHLGILSKSRQYEFQPHVRWIEQRWLRKGTISYATSKSSTALILSRDTIKMKTPEGESKQTLLCDRADGEEYAKHLMSFGQYSGPPRPPWLRISPSRRLQKHSLGKKKLQKP